LDTGERTTSGGNIALDEKLVKQKRPKLGGKGVHLNARFGGAEGGRLKGHIKNDVSAPGRDWHTKE